MIRSAALAGPTGVAGGTTPSQAEAGKREAQSQQAEAMCRRQWGIGAHAVAPLGEEDPRPQRSLPVQCMHCTPCIRSSGWDVQTCKHAPATHLEQPAEATLCRCRSLCRPLPRRKQGDGGRRYRSDASRCIAAIPPQAMQRPSAACTRAGNLAAPAGGRYPVLAGRKSCSIDPRCGIATAPVLSLPTSPPPRRHRGVSVPWCSAPAIVAGLPPWRASRAEDRVVP